MAAQGLRIRLRKLVRDQIGRVRGNVTLEQLQARGMRVGQGVSVASRTEFDYGFAWAISIGDRAIIAHDVRVIAHDASTKRSALGYTSVRRVTIGARAYIGAGTLVLPGATIGDGAMIGAGSLVTGEIPPGMVAVGSPARVIRSVEDHLARIDRSDLPRFDVLPSAASPAELAAMREALDEHGRIFVR